MRSEPIHSKKYKALPLAFPSFRVCLGIILLLLFNACSTLEATQANTWAEQAGQLAAECPAAAEAAAAARSAANRAMEIEQQFSSLSRASDQLRQMDAERQALWQEALDKNFADTPQDLRDQAQARRAAIPLECAQHQNPEYCTTMKQNFADDLVRRAETMEAQSVPATFVMQDPWQSFNDLRADAAACRRNAAWYEQQGQFVTSSPPEECQQGCSGVASCTEKAEYWERSAENWRPSRAEQDRFRDYQRIEARISQLGNQIPMILPSFRENRGALLQQLRDAGYAIPDPAPDDLSIPASMIAVGQQYLGDLRAQAQAGHDEAARIAEEECGGNSSAAPPPASTGQFDQDIHNAQSQGLPGAAPAPPPPPPPPPAGTCEMGSPIYETCTGYTTMCSICTGDCPPECAPCRAAGCF